MITAVILNYRNVALTTKCVDKLCEAGRESDISLEIIVVDNSAPQTAIALRNALPADVIIIENAQNNGFSKANNQGIRQANGELVLIMNNDLFINAQTLKKGAAHLSANKMTGIWAPKLTDPHGKPQRSCARFPTLTGIMNEYLLNRPKDNNVANYAIRARQPLQVDTVIGACMFIPRKILFEVGMFDEDYFFSSEDVDLCRKIKEAGYQIIFDPRSEAIHLYGASQNHSWHDNPYMHKARKLYFKKHHNLLKAILARFIISTGVYARKVKHKFN